MYNARDITTYEDFISHTLAPVFYRPWYLDAVCTAGKWAVAQYIEDNKVKAVWPYFVKSKYGQTYITLPPLTPYLGPWYLSSSDQTKNYSWYSREKKIQQALFDQLPDSRLTIIQMPPELQNWLPLHGRGCLQTTRYTYRLDMTKTENQLISGFTDSQRNTIKKAKEKFQLSDFADATEMWNLIVNTYKKQGVPTPFSRVVFERLLSAGKANHALSISAVKDKEELKGFAVTLNDPHASYLLLTAKTEENTSGSVSLAIWDSIMNSRQQGRKVFDFEGSMIPGIESFFRSFGGKLTPYNRITYTPNKTTELLLRLLNRI